MLSTFLLSALLASAVAFPDKNAPVVTGLTYNKEVTTGSSFIVSLTASDPLGVDYVTFSATPNRGWWFPCPESKNFALVNGTAFEGTWQAECPIPDGTPSQTYKFNYNVVDVEVHSTSEIFKDGFTVSGGPEAEYDAPVIEKITVADTVTAGTMVDMFLTIADASGVNTEMSYINIHETVGNMLPCAATNFALQSGSVTDGVYKTSCLVPSDTANGEYWLEVHVYDTQKNYAEQTVNNAFEVVGGATPDHIIPSITNIVYANTTVERGATMSLTVKVADLDSGVNNVNFQAREPYSQALLCQGAMELQDGDSSSGTWGFSCVVPMDMDYGSYQGDVMAFDKQNNEAMNSKSFQVVL